MILRLLLLIGLVFGVAVPAAADDISAAGRGVVRIVTIAVVDGQVVGFGHGSGFAIAPNRIVTNAHVVDLAERYPDNVVIGVVPSEGDKSYTGRVIAYDSQADLALIEFTGARLPPAALYTGPVTEGDPVVSLGFPGNVDLATARSAADYIKPMSPVRSEGVFSGRRILTNVEVLLHTASIARGNSGGPLLDRCGRVIGVNSAITRGEEGDATFGFAIADTELSTFLREAKQPYASVGTPCTSIEDRLRQDSDADARAVTDAAAARRDAATQAGLVREAALEKARAAAQRGRENVMAVAVLLLVAGALALGAAGLFETQGDRRHATWALGGGAVEIVVAVIVFVLRPSGEIDLPATPAAQAAIVANAPLGKLVCRLVPERSRLTVSSSEDVPLIWGKAGCMNGKTQYVANAGRWERVLVPDTEQSVSVLAFDPATRTYANTRYLMSAAGMATARTARGDAAKVCTTDETALARLGAAQAAVRATLPPLPNEKLVYSCDRAR
ncbi:trypsin-like peptidase domain-containing protein [Sphingomonas ginsenosidivorax]|uniref:Trypsin-like peptidase domain-containing protein n=1 Tax=Sphingomonas ginsenosidivorax TaxID=862135 RepID=A0A5C6UJW8_9SPHN|nr:trypsin-like peptidase domain-containing protein [Sphingomonas ginsenosidivorax]TXC72516.1 trypsin-like peptidase domain-containing protein [Sphingomonas ginsenosidivorax]